MKRNLLFAVLLCWNILAYADVFTRVDPSVIRLGETFRLTITIDAPRPDSIPDLTPLQENFSIVGTERSMAYSIVNGEKHSVNQWIILLMPQKTGTLLIPAIQIGQQQSTAQSIKVTADSNAPAPSNQQDNNTPNDEVWLKTEVDSNKLFINQQAVYTVRLYNSQRLLDAEYQPPRIEDALMIPLGDSRHYQTIHNNRNYAVEEQQYAIFPQKSGNLKIIAPSFKALVFDSVPRQVNVHSKNVEVAVKPIPANYTGKYWLPAKQVALTEIYDPIDTTMDQGSTLTRTVTLQAAGVPAQLLPTLRFDSTAQFNSYPEKPELRNTAKQHDLIGRADIKVTYLLNKAGEITIPALKVDWFNTDSGKEESVSLPARTISIKAKGSAQQAPSETLTPHAVLPTKHIDTLPTGKSDNFAWWLAGCFALAWILTLSLWWLRKSAPAKSNSKRAALKQLQQACKNNNPAHAQEALLQWAAIQWPNSTPINLHHIAKLVHDTNLKKQLTLLSQALYSQEKNALWQGEALWHSVTSYLRKKPVSKSKRNGLPPINPI